MKNKIMAMAAAIILSVTVIGCGNINKPSMETSLDSSENGNAEPKGSAETEGSSEPKGSTETEGSAEPEGSAETEGSSEPKGSAEAEGSSEPKGSAETEGSSEPKGSAEAEGSSEPKGSAETENKGVNKVVKSQPLGNQTENGYVIAIDAGHQAKGNKEKEPLGPGSNEQKAKVSSGTKGVSTGIYEYELTLTISQALKGELENRGYQTIMIRDTADVNISNKERAETANDSGADIFLRIHANGSQDSKVQGTLTICNTSKSPFNPEIYEQSKSLSQLVVDRMTSVMESKNRGVWETDTMSGINWCKITVSIIEMGYMSNAEEDERMQDGAYQVKIVQGIADGVDAYFAANP